jgi:hypothetical protein
MVRPDGSPGFMVSVVVAPLDAIIGILAIRHFLTISEESLPEEATIVLEKSPP